MNDQEIEADANVPAETERENVLDVDPDLEVVSTSYDITSYGADYPVDGLVRRLGKGDIVIPTFDPNFEGSEDIRGFQRKFVWSRPQMDRFIESLLLGLPVPGIFLVRDRDNKLLVLDGQQRLKTLQAYYNLDRLGADYRLRNVQAPFQGMRYQDLDDEDRRRLDDSIIHATVLRQEHPAGNQDAVYSIFERLNTGGSPLQPQEIRVALYSGTFLQEIGRAATDPHWRNLYGDPSPRLKDHELILRVLALYENLAGYERPLKTFLNHYLDTNRNRSNFEALFHLFRGAAAEMDGALGRTAFRPVRPLNAAILDSVFVGVMRRLEVGPIANVDQLKTAYDDLLSDEEYVSAIDKSTADETSVNRRIELATAAFQNVV